MVPATLSLGAQHLICRARNQNLSARCQYNVTGWIIKLCVWGMIFQWGSTLKVSIELPATSKHCRDMTERLLTATKNMNKTIRQIGQSLHVCFIVILGEYKYLCPGGPGFRPDKDTLLLEGKWKTLSTKLNSERKDLCNKKCFRSSQKHAYIILIPLKTHFYIVNRGRGIHYFSYFCSKHRLWYSLEPPCWDSSNEYPQSMF